MSRRRKRPGINPVLILASVLIFMAGAGIFVYPAVSNYLAERRQAEAIGEYKQDVEALGSEAIEEQKIRAREYNRNLADDGFHDPFFHDGQYVISSEYHNVLNYNKDGIMGYLVIPDIDVEIPIYHGTSEKVLQRGAGHLEASSLPVGGEGTHSVISAHRGLPSAKLFTDLDKLKAGSVFYIHILDETLAYQVDQIEVVNPDELNSLRIIEGRDLVTLLTCTPYAVNTHRLLVRGTRIPYTGTEGEQNETESGNTVSQWVKEYFISIIAAIVLLVFLLLLIKTKNRNKKKRGKKRRFFSRVSRY